MILYKKTKNYCVKNIVIIVLLSVSVCFSSYAQHPVFANKLNTNTKVMNYQEVDQKSLHFGFCLGINTLDYNIGYRADAFLHDSLLPDVTRIAPGFHVNIVTEFRLSENFSFRFLPGIIFSQRNITYWNQNKEIVKEFQMESNLLDFPMLIKYKAKRINNYRPYIIAGGNTRFDMAAKTKYDDDDDVFIRIRKFDVFYEVGFGIDFYLPYFKFTTEIKWSEGIRNMLSDDPHPRHPQYVNAIDRMNAKAFLISFYFE